MKTEQGHHIVLGHKSLETCSQPSHNGRRRASCPSPIGNAIREGTLDVVVSRLCGAVEPSVFVDHIVWSQDRTPTQKVSSFDSPGQGSDLAEHEEVCSRQGRPERIGVVSVSPIHLIHQSFKASVVSVFKVNPSIAAAHAVVEGSSQKLFDLNGSWSIVCKK
jgi:hypothetical protein